MRNGLENTNTVDTTVAFNKGERMLPRGNGGSISRYQLSIKGELQRIDSQWEGIFRILWSLMEDQGIFVVTQPKSSHTSPLPLPPTVTNTDLSRILEFRCLKILQLESGATYKEEMCVLIKDVTLTAFPALDYCWKYLKATPSAGLKYLVT